MQTDPDVPTSIGLDAWLARLAEPTGAPGGGSAAGVMMGIAAALLHMVCGYTPDGPAEVASAAETVRALRERSLRAAEEDGIRSVALGAAMAAKGPARDADLHRAAVAAAASSAHLADVGVALAEQLRVIAEVGNPSLVADTGVAGEALRAGLGAAVINLRSNVRLAEAHRAEGETRGDLAPFAETADQAVRTRSEIDALLASLPLS